MPYKLNEAHRDKFPKAKYHVTNWSEYDRGLVQRGDMNCAGFAGGSNSRVVWSIMTKTTNKYSPEVRERAVRMVLDGFGASPE